MERIPSLEGATAGVALGLRPICLVGVFGKIGKVSHHTSGESVDASSLIQEQAVLMWRKLGSTGRNEADPIQNKRNADRRKPSDPWIGFRDVGSTLLPQK